MAIIDLYGVEVLSREDGMKMIDELTRKNFNMTSGEFIEAWNEGRFDDDPDSPEVMDIVTLFPFIEQ